MRKPDEPESFAPPTTTYTLASGRVVTFTQPDLFDLASGRIELPNRTKLDIWGLLLRGGDDNPTQQLLSDETYIRSLYASAQLITTPRTRLDDEDDRDAPIDRREWSLTDLLAAFRFLRFGPPPPAARAEPGSAQAATPAGDGLPQGAE